MVSNGAGKGKVSFKSDDIKGVAAAAAACAAAEKQSSNKNNKDVVVYAPQNNKDGNDYGSFSPTYSRRLQLERTLGSRGVLCGIKNIGATCYAASLLQTIFMTPEMRHHIISFPFEEKQRHKNNIAYQLQLMFAEMQGSRKSFVDPTNLLLSFNMGPGAHTQQHDVQELNRQLVDVIQGFIDRKTGTRQVIQELYRGETGDLKKCRGCGAESFQGGHVYLDVQVPVVGYPTLEKALAQYVQPDIIEGWKCDACNSSQTLEKGAVFQSFPRVLSIHLMRFVFNMESLRRDKVDDDIALPVEMDVSPLLDTKHREEGASGDDHQQLQQKYQVNAIICHRGTPFHGHYYCFVRVADEKLSAIASAAASSSSSTTTTNKPQEILDEEAEIRRIIGGEWVKFDDDRVTVADPDEVLQYMNPAMWKQRKHDAREKRLAAEAEKSKKEQEAREAKQQQTSSSSTTDAAAAAPSADEKKKDETAPAPATSSIENKQPDGEVTQHPLMPDAATANNSNEKNSDGLTKADEEDIAGIFSEAFGSMVDGGSGSSAAGPLHQVTHTVSGHSYYVLYRRSDMPPVRVADVNGFPAQDDVPDYVRAHQEASEKELREAAAELETLQHNVSVGVWYNKKRTWIDVHEGTTVDELTQLAYQRCVLDPLSTALTVVVAPSSDSAPAAAAAAAAASSSKPISSGSSTAAAVTAAPSAQTEPGMGAQDASFEGDGAPSLFGFEDGAEQQQQQTASPADNLKVTEQLNRDSAAGTATVVIDNKAQAHQQMMKQHSSSSNKDDDNDNMTMIRERSNQLTELEHVLHPSGPPPPPPFSKAVARLRRYSTSWSVGGATFDGTETMLSLGHKSSTSSHGVFYLETRAEADAAEQGPWKAATELDLCFRTARVTRETPINVPITDFHKIVLPADGTLKELFEACAKEFNIPGGIGSTQLTWRKDGEAVPLSVWEAPKPVVVNFGDKNKNNASGAGSDDVSLFGSLLGSSADDSKHNNAEEEMTDMKNKDRAPTSSSTAAAAAAAAADVADDGKAQQRKPYYRDLEKTTIKRLGLSHDDVIFVESFDPLQLPAEAADLKPMLVAVQFVDYQYLIKVYWNVSSGIDMPPHLDRSVPLFVDKRKSLSHLKEKLCDMFGLTGDDSQMLLDGAVREPKNLEQTIRAATYGLSTLNVEMRKGRRLQENESYVTVYLATDDFLNPVTELKRVLVRDDTSVRELALAALPSSDSSDDTTNDDDHAAAPTSSAAKDSSVGVKKTEDQQGGEGAGEGERCLPQPGGGATRVTSVCINGNQHYRPRLMPAGTNVRSWGAPMYKREVKSNLTNQHRTEQCEIRVVFQPIAQEEALTKNSLCLRFQRWNAKAADVQSALLKPSSPPSDQQQQKHLHNSVVLYKDGDIMSILSVFSKLSPDIPEENIEFARCRAYQMRSQEAICNDLMWLSRSFLEMESSKRRTLSGHPMRLESDEIVLYRDSDEGWPDGAQAQFGFESIQSNSQLKSLHKKQGNTASEGADVAGDNKKKNNRPAERGISLRVVWDQEEPSATATEQQKTDRSSSADAVAAECSETQQQQPPRSKNLDDIDGDGSDVPRTSLDKNKNKTDSDADSVAANADDEPSTHDGGPSDVLATDAAATATQSNNNNTDNAAQQPAAGGVAASVGVSNEELINFVPCEAYGQLHRLSLPPACCVCFCEFADDEQICVTKCHHIVHKECLAPWLAQEFSCPQCRTSLW